MVKTFEELRSELQETIYDWMLVLTDTNPTDSVTVSRIQGAISALKDVDDVLREAMKYGGVV